MPDNIVTTPKDDSPHREFNNLDFEYLTDFENKLSHFLNVIDPQNQVKSEEIHDTLVDFSKIINTATEAFTYFHSENIKSSVNHMAILVETALSFNASRSELYESGTALKTQVSRMITIMKPIIEKQVADKVRTYFKILIEKEDSDLYALASLLNL